MPISGPGSKGKSKDYLVLIKGNTPDDPEAKIELYDKGKGEKALPRIKLRTKYCSLVEPTAGKPVVQLASGTYGSTIFHTKRDEDRTKLADMFARFIAAKDSPHPHPHAARPSRVGTRPVARSQSSPSAAPVRRSASTDSAASLSPTGPTMRRAVSPDSMGSAATTVSRTRTQRSPQAPPVASSRGAGRKTTQRLHAPRAQTAGADVEPRQQQQQQQQQQHQRSSQPVPTPHTTPRQTSPPAGPSMSPPPPDPSVASRQTARQLTLRKSPERVDDGMGIKWAPANANAKALPATAATFAADFDGFGDSDDDDDFFDDEDDDTADEDNVAASPMSSREAVKRVTLRKGGSGVDLATTEALRHGAGLGAGGSAVLVLEGMYANEGEEDTALNKTPDGYGVPSSFDEGETARDPRIQSRQPTLTKAKSGNAAYSNEKSKMEEGTARDPQIQRRPTLTKAKPGNAAYSNEKSATLQFYDKNDPLGLDDNGYGYPNDVAHADGDAAASSPAASPPPPLVDYQPSVNPAVVPLAKLLSGGQRVSTLDGQSDTLVMGKSIAAQIRQEGAAMEAEAARLEREIADEVLELSMETPDTSLSNPFGSTVSQEDEYEDVVEELSSDTRQEAEVKLKAAGINGGFIVRTSKASTSGMTISVYDTLNDRPHIRHHLIEAAKGGGVRMPESQRIHADWQALTSHYYDDHGGKGNYFEVTLRSLTRGKKKKKPTPPPPELDHDTYPEFVPGFVADQLATELAKAGPSYAPERPVYSDSPQAFVSQHDNERHTKLDVPLYMAADEQNVPSSRVLEAVAPPASAVCYSESPQTFSSVKANERHITVAEPLYADAEVLAEVLAAAAGPPPLVDYDVPALASPASSSSLASRSSSGSSLQSRSSSQGPRAIDTEDMYSTPTDEPLPEEPDSPLAPSAGPPLQMNSKPAAGQALNVMAGGHSVTQTLMNLPVVLTGHEQLPTVETHGIDPAQVMTLITKMMFKKTKEKKVDLVISNGKFQLRASQSNPEVYQALTNIVYSSQCALDRLAIVFKIGKLYKCYAIKVTDLTHMTLILERIQEATQALTSLGATKTGGGGIGRNRPTSMMLAKKMATKRRSMKQQAKSPEAKMFSFKRHSLTLADVENQQNLADPIGLFRCWYVTGLPLTDFNTLSDHAQVISRKLDDCGSAKHCNPELVECALTITPLGLKIIQMDTSEELLDIYVNEIVHLKTITDKRSLRPIKKLKFKIWDQPLTMIVTSKRLGVGGQPQTGCEMLYVEEELVGAELLPLLQEICTRAAHRHGRLRETFLGVPGEENDSTITEAATGLRMVDRARLDCINVLGRGQYGEVFLASDLARRQQVAVKMTAGELSVEEASDFLGEAEIMGPLQHACIIELIGVEVRCQPWLIVLEFCKYGDLRALLKHCGHPSSSKIAYIEQLYCCYQVASALGYVAKKQLVHMDVATRNVLVCPKSRVKLADFGIAQKIPAGEMVWTMYDTMKLPARWQAPESWKYKTFGPKTDCWSFGMMCWEVASHGCLPMQEVKLQQIPAHVVAGGVPVRAAETPDDFHDLMASCWRSDPETRPSFEEICTTIANLATALQANGYTLRDLGLLITSPEEAESTKVPWTFHT